MFTTMIETDRALAATMRSLREERGLAQEALAQKAGISTGSLSRIERGVASPAWATVRCIADALDISLIELVDFVEAGV
jgi:transcriptional regulator with XRE-family HTH domain